MSSATAMTDAISITSTAGSISILSAVSKSYFYHWASFVESIRLFLEPLAKDPKFTQEAKDLVPQLILLVWAVYIDRHLEVITSLCSLFKNFIFRFSGTRRQARRKISKLFRFIGINFLFVLAFVFLSWKYFQFCSNRYLWALGKLDKGEISQMEPEGLDQTQAVPVNLGRKRTSK
jgi:hypothetical protein